MVVMMMLLLLLMKMLLKITMMSILGRSGTKLSMRPQGSGPI
jgi:hypothetical protein